MEFISNSGKRATKEIDKESITMFTLNNYLRKDQEVFLLVTAYYVGGKKIMALGGLTLEKSSDVREKDGDLVAELMFDRIEYAPFEQYGKVVNFNGREMIKTPVLIKKEDIIAAAAVV